MSDYQYIYTEQSVDVRTYRVTSPKQLTEQEVIDMCVEAGLDREGEMQEDKETKMGVIAQEVLKVIPEVVQKDKDGRYSVAYGNMNGLLIEAIKELKAEIEQLKSKI